jgi:hypothetical protein
MSSYTLKVEFLDRLEHITKNIEDRVSLNTDQYNRVVRIGFNIIDLYIENAGSVDFRPALLRHFFNPPLQVNQGYLSRYVTSD